MSELKLKYNFIVLAETIVIYISKDTNCSVAKEVVQCLSK